ncbi:MAG TPA: hypothetical protein VJM15_00650 [Sphingomicrobium sp.]|nr:hypothetical protein [Sphingomicrobium sp.]
MITTVPATVLLIVGATAGIHYVPGLDVYLAGARGALRWLGLFEDSLGALQAPARGKRT